MNSTSDWLRFIEVTISNFLSFGPESTRIRFDEPMLVAVLGLNYDAGGRNGSGKSVALIDSVSYALFGKTVRAANSAFPNSNLIHKLARKGQSMTVTLEYTRGNRRYLIERGENPSRLYWFEKDINDERNWRTTKKTANGDSKLIFDKTQAKTDTNQKIIDSIGFDQTLFTYLVGNSSEAIPFIRLPESQRRDVIESLFGFKRLSLIAETLKKDRDTEKTKLAKGEASIAATEAANARVQAQIDGLIQKKISYYQPFQRRKDAATLRLNEQIHADKKLCMKFEQNEFIKSLPNSVADRFGHVAALPSNQDQLSQLNADIEDRTENLSRAFQFASDEINRTYNSKIADATFGSELLQEFGSLPSRITMIQRDLVRVRKDLEVAKNLIATTQGQLERLDESLCPSCGQSLTPEHREKERKNIETVLPVYLEQQKTEEERIASLEPVLLKDQARLDILTKEKLAADQLVEQLKNEKLNELSKLDEREDLLQMAVEIEMLDTLVRQTVEQEAARSEAIELAKQFLEGTVRTNELLEEIQQATRDLDPEKNPDPYQEQIDSLTKDALVDVRAMLTENETRRVMVEHYQLLIDLATQKDSFIRKQLVQRWLPHLNQRIASLLRELELPHTVRFNAQMDMEMSLHRSEYHPSSLSKGERARLIVAINKAFQELYEIMNNAINLHVVDELIDNGIDSQGAENAVNVLSRSVREKQKSVFLITHRSDIQDKVGSTMTVIKENDFSRISWSKK